MELSNTIMWSNKVDYIIIIKNININVTHESEVSFLVSTAAKLLALCTWTVKVLVLMS